ncbi:MAG: hypothetical protein V3T31_06315 [candidate division Zixibacteria bacterium]
MKTKRRLLRRIGKWSIWITVALLTLFALQLTLLAFPQIVLSHSVRVGTVVLYYDEGEESEMVAIASDAEERLKGCPFYDSARSDRVYYFQDEEIYGLFTKLMMMRNDPQGFNLSVFGNSFVSAPIVRELAAESGGEPKYSIWEGSAAHIIAHEIGHQYLIDRYGRSVWINLPHWKQEGLPEFMANIGPIRADSSASLRARLELLRDDQVWAKGNNWRRKDWDRIHYEAGLLVEYLLEVEGYSIEEILDDSIIRKETLSRMINWSATARNLHG